MNRIKLIRLSIVFLIILAIIIAIVNFSPSPEIVVEDKKNDLNASMVVEGGSHEIYSQGSKFARVSYKKAVEDKNILKLYKVNVIFFKNNGKLTSDYAEFKKDTLEFKSETSGFLPDKKAKIKIHPPAYLTDGVLKGKKRIILSFPDFSLSGMDYAFRVKENSLFIRHNATLSSKNFRIDSVFNVSRFESDGVFVFFKDTVIKTEGIEIKSDIAVDFEDKSRIVLNGNCFAKSKDTEIFFSQGEIIGKQKGLSMLIPHVFFFTTPNLKGRGRDLTLNRQGFKAEYLKSEFNAYVFSGVKNSYSKSSSILTGFNPYLFSRQPKKTISGQRYRLKNKILEIFSPLYRDESTFLVSSYCKIKSNSIIVFPERVDGIFADFAFSGKSAYVDRETTVVKEGEIVSIQNETDRLRGDSIKLLSDKTIEVKGNAFVSKTMQKGQRGTIKCHLIKITEKGNRIDLSGNVKIKGGNFKAHPLNAIVFKKYAILFNCNFEIEGKYIGFARVMALNYSGRYSYLFFAKVEDANGNTLKGDKLTLDNLTDRIFIEKARKKGQVEVKIKL